MINRCHNPHHVKYPRYGARGIVVCERWRSSFLAFVLDMGERPAGHTIERIDVNGSYEPGNCRWATAKEQARNKTDNNVLTLNGETKCIAEWADCTGIPSHTIRARIGVYGWSIERALTEPVNPPGRKRTERILSFNGIALRVSEWAQRTGISGHTLRHRLAIGWSVERTLTTPLQDRK